MTITAKNAGRIDVWPSGAVAREADTEESKVFGRMTIWKTISDARDHLSVGEGGGGDDEFVLQLDGQNLQFDGQDLTLGA